jgi:hypothetical protein
MDDDKVIDNFFKLSLEFSDVAKEITKNKLNEHKNYRNIIYTLIFTLIFTIIIFGFTLMYQANKAYDYESYPTIPSVTNNNNNNNNN